MNCTILALESCRFCVKTFASKRNAVLLHFRIKKSYSSGTAESEINICRCEKEAAGPQANHVSASNVLA